MRNYDASDVKADATEFVDQAERVQIVGDTEVAALFILFNIVRGNGNDDLRAVSKLIEHLDLTVGKEARKHTGGMIVIEELAAEFQIELSSEGFDSVKNFL